jgi:dTDP-glucose 4,6-dehydratase
MRERVIVTGGCGFIGHHLVEHLLKKTDWDIIVLDRLTYASSGFNRLRDIKAFDDRRVSIFTTDLSEELGQGMLMELGDVAGIIHMCAETHVDNSIADPWPFVRTNVVGTFRMLELARKLPNLKRFIYFSTDEVFGPAPDAVRYKEWDRYNSTNPYSATKAAGEELCLAWANTYKLPVIVTHTMNAFGERQHPEKFFPMIVRRVLAGESVTIHADPSKTRPGSRFYIHCRNIADAVLTILCGKHGTNSGKIEAGEVRDKFNIVGEKEMDNLQLARTIAEVLGKPLHYELMDFHSSRPGHDLRYALDGSKMKDVYGWAPPATFEESLRRTVRWMVAPENARWLDLHRAIATAKA